MINVHVGIPPTFRLRGSAQDVRVSAANNQLAGELPEVRQVRGRATDTDVIKREATVHCRANPDGRDDRARARAWMKYPWPRLRVCTAECVNGPRGLVAWIYIDVETLRYRRMTDRHANSRGEPSAPSFRREIRVEVEERAKRCREAKVS